MPTPAAASDFRTPDLADPSRYRVIRQVPLLDAHEHSRKGNVDRRLLETIARNSNHRADDLDTPALVLLGHTTDEGTEEEQPPVVGYARSFRVDQFKGRPCLYADFYIHADDYDRAVRFPHRSVERWRGPRPEDNYVDAVALMRRSPERPLGVLERNRRGLPPGVALERHARDLPDLRQIENENHQGMNIHDPEAFADDLLQMLKPFIVKVIENHSAEPAEEDDLPPLDGPAGDEPPPDAAPGPEGHGPDEGPPPEGDEGPEEEEAPEQYGMAAPNVPLNPPARMSKHRARTAPKAAPKAAPQDADRRELARYRRLESEVKHLRYALVMANRERVLYGLREDEGIQFDMERELARAAQMTDGQFDDHVEAIRENYARTPEGDLEVEPVPHSGLRAEGEDFTREDTREVWRYAREHNIPLSDPLRAVQEYARAKQQGRAGARETVVRTRA